MTCDHCGGPLFDPIRIEANGSYFEYCSEECSREDFLHRAGFPKGTEHNGMLTETFGREEGESTEQFRSDLHVIRKKKYDSPSSAN